MMAVALALARSGPSRRAPPACALAATRRVARHAASASGGGSAVGRRARAPRFAGGGAAAFPPGARASAHASGPSAPDALTPAARSRPGPALTLPAPGVVHLWLVDPHGPASDPSTLAFYERRCLAPEEAAALRDGAPMTDAARRQAIQSKALTRCVLARYCGEDVAPASLRFAYGEHGKPALVAVESDDSDRASSSSEEEETSAAASSSLAPPPPIRFSVSHCANLLALAVTTAPPGSRESKQRTFPAGAAVPFAASHEVGVDCEDETRRTSGSCDRLASRWLSDAEANSLARVEGERERAATFMRLWTLKEAYVKALGTGIAAHPLKGFDVELLTSDDGEDEDAEDEARARGSAETGRESSSGSGGTPGGTTPRAARVRLTERSGSSESERSAWARSAGSWRFALVRPRRGANEIASVCAWIEEEGGGEEGGDGEGPRGPRGTPRGAPEMVVRWTVPGRGGDADVEGEHELVAASG